MAQLLKNLPAMQETRVQSLGREYPLEKKMATHWATVHEVPRVRHNLVTKCQARVTMWFVLCF